MARSSAPRPATLRPAPPLPEWFLPVVSLGCLILFVLHASGRVELDTIGLLLVASCAAVWLLPNVTKFKVGDLELELKIVALVEAQAEPGKTGNMVGTENSTQPPDLIKALDHARYAFRTEPGLRRDTDLDREDLRDQLHALEDRGLVQRLSGADGRRLWGLTADGRTRL